MSLFIKLLWRLRMYLRSIMARTFALLAIFTASLLAQRNTAELVGTVTDATGAVVPGARISVSKP